VAELITVFGRDALSKMQARANELSFSTLYDDTDSLYVNNVNDPDQFISECKSKLGIDVAHDKTFSKLILIGKKHKKHYIGIQLDPRNGRCHHQSVICYL
jgi:DNA polymerase elongation subunit (family B)